MNLSDITNHKSLKILQISSLKLNFDPMNENSSLIIIIFNMSEDYESPVTGSIDLQDNFYAADTLDSNQERKDFAKFIIFVPSIFSKIALRSFGASQESA